MAANAGLLQLLSLVIEARSAPGAAVRAYTLALCLLGVLCLGVRPAGAQEVRYVLRHWTTADGLPSHSINGIVEGPRGYLWLTTQGGLVRYDGHRFTVLSGEGDLEGSRFHAIFVDRRGRLLVSGDDRFYRLGEHGFELLARGLQVRSIGETSDGTIWGGNTYEQARLLPEGIWTDHRAGPNLDVVPALRRFVQSGSTVDLTAFRRVPHPDIGAVYEVRERNGQFEVADEAGVRWRVAAEPAPELRFVGRNRYLWVTGPGTVTGVPEGNVGPEVRITLPDLVRVNALYQGADGELWIGTDTHGLYRAQQAAAVSYGRLEGATDNQVRMIALGPDGRVRLSDALRSGFVVSRDERTLEPITPSEFAFADEAGWAWHIDWLEGRQEMLGIRADLERRSPLPGRLPGRPRLLRAAAGGVWIGGLEWLARFDPAGSPDAPWARVVHGLSNLVALAEDSAGTLYMLSDDGVTRLSDTEPIPVVARDALPRGELRALYLDGRGDIWVGTYGQGMVRVRERRVDRLRAEDGLTENIVTSIVEDGLGGLWTAGNQGIQRLAMRDLDAFFAGERTEVAPLRLTRSEDLRNPETSGWPTFVDPRGRLWFPTFGGAVVVDPARVTPGATVPPPVWIESVREARRLEVGYSAIALNSADQVRFQYRLEGVDSGWVNAGRARSAVYNDVPAGRRRFQVRAARAGDWSEPASVTVFVPPFWWETGPARVAFVIAAMLLVAGFVRWRAAQLRARADELEVQVAVRTEQLREERERVAAQARELQQLFKARTEFFANVSHEFRTPLTLIQGPVADIAAGAHGPVPSAVRDLLRLAHDNAGRLLRLVDQLLDLSRAESGLLIVRRRPVDLALCIRSICESFEAGATKAGLTLVVATPPGEFRVSVDPDHLEKMIVNLVGNAVKYTDRGGRVSVEAELAGDDQGEVVIRVRDTGLGIAADDLPHIFERYFRGPASSNGRDRTGTGLGLALVRQLVEAHEGRVEVESRVGEGSVFTIRLPRGEGEPSGVVGGEDAPDAGLAERPTILVVDDNSDLRQYLSQSLVGRFRLIEARDGGEALNLVRTELPDLVVSDVMMPVMDGFDLCRAIKADPETEFVPVILLTARASTDSRVAGMETGADDYLVKPFNMRELAARISNLIDGRRRWLARQPVAVGTEVSATALLPPAPVDPFLTALHAAIEARLGEERVTAETLAADLKISRATLFRRVEQATGMGPMDLVWEARLVRAAELLRTGTGTVAEIAYGLGFTSLSHFSRRFRARYLMSPSAWRFGGV